MIEGVSWVGVATERVAEMENFCAAVLGLNRRVKRQDFVVFDAPNGDRLEIFGPAGPQQRYQFEMNPVVVGFQVQKIDVARTRLAAAGIELLGDLERGSTGSAWQHFRAPDGRVYELNQAGG